MKTVSRTFTLLCIIGALFLAACGGGGTPTPENAPAVVTDDFAVIAEGRVMPAQYVQLSFSTGGKVVELPITEGATVKANDVLAKLENSEALQAEVTRAELEVLNAQQALKNLRDNADLATAQAQKAIVDAQTTLDTTQKDLVKLKNPDIQYYRDQLKKAQAALANAKDNVTVVDIGPLYLAQANAKEQLKKATDIYNDAKDALARCPNCTQVYVNAAGYEMEWKDVDRLYNDAVNNMESIKLQIAQAERQNSTGITDAERAVRNAQRDLDWVLKGPEAIDVAQKEADIVMAEANLAEAQRTYEKVKAGPDPDQLALAQSRLATAQAGLTAAKAALDKTELRAPFAGTVADLNLKVGEQVAPGQIIATLADLTRWTVETDNLTEIEVVKISLGQNATVVLDALPDSKLRGAVTAINSVYEEKRGDITYTITIALSDTDPLMRWGMTAEVTFDK